METPYVVDDFTQYQHIRLIEDPVLELNYCMPVEVRCLARLIQASDAKTVLEIGTQAGMTTYYLSRNLRHDGVLYTIDITKDMLAAKDVLDEQCTEILAIDEVGWYHRAHKCQNVTQIIGDSRVFNYEDVGITEIDLCFIDGNHRLEAVYRDVVNALPHMHRGAYLVWHDFDGIASPHKDVNGAIRELVFNGVLEPPIFAITGTRMAYTVL